MRRSRIGRLSLLGVFVLMLLLSREAQACEICKYVFFFGYQPCRAVSGDEVGATTCTNLYDVWSGFSCQESGTYCSNITVGGGGSGGGSGGGWGGGCSSNGFCPAECFTCTGGSN